MNIATSVILISCVLIPSAARAQSLTVQQPVVSQFGVGTTVVVPDRGGISLGGVSRGFESRNSAGFGPGPLFRSRGIGREYSSSSMSVHTTIHDFDAYDRLLLHQANAQSHTTAASGFKDPLARSAYLSLNGRAASDPQPQGPTINGKASSDRDQVKAQGESKALDFYQRGLKAEAAGKANVAEIYFRVAASYGSDQAAFKLKGSQPDVLVQTKSN